MPEPTLLEVPLPPPAPSSPAAPASNGKYSPAAHLVPYQFQKGNKLGGRTFGSKNRLSAAEILKHREARIATRYVKRTEKSDAVLMHAMDRLLPAKSVLPGPMIVVFTGDGSLPRVSADPQQVVVDQNLPKVEIPKIDVTCQITDENQ